MFQGNSQVNDFDLLEPYEQFFDPLPLVHTCTHLEYSPSFANLISSIDTLRFDFACLS